MTDLHKIDDPIQALLGWHGAGQGGALAVVVETWGSAPRPVGSLLAISEEAALVGSVSGGCVEGAVVAEALEMGQNDAPRLLRYGVSDEAAFAVGLACGGQIAILVLPMNDALAQALAAVDRQRRAQAPVILSLDVQNGAARAEEADAHMARLRAEVSGYDAAGARFLVVFAPPLRLLVVGGVHIAQALAPMAQIAGYAVSVIDPRAAFAAPARFPGLALSHDWPDEALAAQGLDTRTAVVCLTHDPKIDDPALIAALPSAAFYVGALGSTRTHAKRVARLEAAGLSADQIARLDAPIGLDIGARTPAEIAVAVLAAMTQSLRRG